jgi:thioredoxin-related protein
MYVLIFSTTFVWNISHSTKNQERYDKKCILVFIQSTCYSCQIWMKVLDIFEKNPPISNFMEIRPVVAELFHADRHDEANDYVMYPILDTGISRHISLSIYDS